MRLQAGVVARFHLNGYSYPLLGVIKRTDPESYVLQLENGQVVLIMHQHVVYATVLDIPDAPDDVDGVIGRIGC
jgi:hypothetical protein